MVLTVLYWIPHSYTKSVFTQVGYLKRFPFEAEFSPDTQGIFLCDAGLLKSVFDLNKRQLYDYIAVFWPFLHKSHENYLFSALDVSNVSHIRRKNNNGDM